MLKNQSFVAIVAGALGVAICATAAAQTGGDAALVKTWKQAGAAKVAIASTPPYAFVSPSGEPQGYLIEVSQEVLKGLGVPKLTAVVTTWDAMIPGLQARQYDFLPGGMNITAARCQVVAFTVPVTAQQDALYVKPGNPKKLTGYASAAKNADARVAVLAGSSQEAYATKQNVPAGQLMRVPDIQSGIAAVTGGRADAFIVGQFSVAEPEKKGVERVVDLTSPAVGIALAFRKEDAATRDAFDVQINGLKANGTMKKLYVDKYGFNNWDLLARTNKATDIVPDCK
ncbi:MAG: ectoine/hydroxyectoine ABC transporter substrate-binding protein EhuB [Rhodospirillales bacterium]|nr:ectoine/hydroxyectoine ABC transporter substrate-binding protein EhuB [Rhodospirillales bacterium]